VWQLNKGPIVLFCMLNKATRCPKTVSSLHEFCTLFGSQGAESMRHITEMRILLMAAK
jgi:hypothetical protein